MPSLCRLIDRLTPEHVAVNDRGGPLLIGGEMHFRPHVRMYLTDILDRNLSFDDERIPIRHDIENLVAAIDHSSDRKNGEADHLSAIWRTDDDAVKNSARVHELGDDLEQLGLGVAQIFGEVCHPVVVQLGGLLKLLGDRLAGLGDVRPGVRNLAVQAIGGSFELQDARLATKPFSTSGISDCRSSLTDVTCFVKAAACPSKPTI